MHVSNFVSTDGLFVGRLEPGGELPHCCFGANFAWSGESGHSEEDGLKGKMQNGKSARKS